MADTENNEQNSSYSNEIVRTGDTPLSAVADQAGAAANTKQNNKDVPEKFKYMDEP